MMFPAMAPKKKKPQKHIFQKGAKGEDHANNVHLVLLPSASGILWSSLGQSSSQVQ